VDDADDLVADDPGLGIGFAVQNPATPYWILLLPGAAVRLRRRQFRLLDVEHLFFFPKAEKGNALALNAGLGNLGVSVMQFLVPLVITAGVFGGWGAAADRIPGDTSSGCRMPASSGCPSSSLGAFAPGSA
jgi:NNP family nitrate/nitrite transporter-like MFS transporter